MAPRLWDVMLNWVAALAPYIGSIWFVRIAPCRTAASSAYHSSGGSARKTLRVPSSHCRVNVSK